MDHNLKTDRSSVRQEQTECLKHTRFKDDSERETLDSGCNSIPVRHVPKSDTFQVALLNEKNHKPAEHTSQETFKEHADYEHETLSESINRAGNTFISQHKTFNSFIPKESSCNEEVRNGNDIDNISVSCISSLNNCTGKDTHGGLKIKTPSNLDKHLVHGTREINGCRPKQKMLPKVKSHFRKIPFGVNDQYHSRRKDLVYGKSFLKAMIGKDSAAIVTGLSQYISVLKDCIRRASKDEEFLEVLLQVLAKAFTSRSTPRLMISLFDALKESGFFETVEKYLVSMIIRLTTGKTEVHAVEPMLRNILSVIVEQITRNPSSVFVFRKLHALLGQIVDKLAVSDSVDEELILKYQHLSKQRKDIEKEQKNYPDKKQYPKPQDDFRHYSVSPTANEITSITKPTIRPNKVGGVYEDLHEYLDVQFRLLREDFVGPLREGMTQYIQMSSEKKTQMTKEAFRNLDIKVYENVRIHSPVITQKGLCYKLQIKMTTGLRKIEWKFSKRLIYGSMVCLTDTDFNNFFLATVVEREERDIKRGFFTVHFERDDVTTEDVLDKVFRMVETTGYFESYKHVLKSLQTFKDGDLPFEKYIVHCQKETDPPAYLAYGNTYDLRPLVHKDVELTTSSDLCDDIIKTGNEKFNKNLLSSKSNTAIRVNVLDLKTWPSKELLHMDKSQYEAVQNALTSEFAIIQGPPGTGKTYIGLQIVKALLHNKSVRGIGLGNRPMLIVCYTNHALDQFLEGIVEFFNGDLMRVGGRSNSDKLEQFNLKTNRKKDEEKGSTLAGLKFNMRQARREMENNPDYVQRLARTIQVYRTEIVFEDVLSQEMNDNLYDDLIYGYRGGDEKDDFSVIVKWLEIEQIKKNCRTKAQSETREKRNKLIQVEDEAGQMQKDRIIDILEECCSAEYEHELLQSIREDIAFFVPDTNLTQMTYFRSKYLKLLKSTVADKISDEDIMSQEEADNIDDIWELTHDERWRLYRLWIQKLCTRLYRKIESEREEFEEAAKKYQDALEEVDKEIMRNTEVIGMTTSCAARYQSVLREIGPKIIVVEEAAEVLEAHIITTLSKKCEHLILIGDHKQLRPNPTVYKLAVKYNLDVSLFERMVKNGMKFNCLELQHRMRPEISSIIRHIYPELKDHEHVKSYPNVKGISTNIFLVNHSHLEYSDTDIRSYSNEKEAKYVVALCRYLLQQGYENREITILTTYTGQLMCMKNLMPKKILMA